MRRPRAIFPTVTIVMCLAGSVFAFGGPGAKGYVGSGKCGECHDKVYAQWSLTPHANMLRDARKNPRAVAAIDFSRVPFKKKDVYWSIGSHWIQKYITFIDNDYYVLPKYWNLVADDWEPYSIFNWREKPYTIWCDGCHTTGFDPDTKSFSEPSIGCEACHGPGQNHVESGGDPAAIVDPARLSKERRDMICEACHTDGKDTKAGGQFPFPAKFRPGEDLNDYYTNFFAPKPKSKKWYWGTMDYRERHRMFMFWQSKFYSTARACDVCGFDRGVTVRAERFMTRDEYCGTCHGKIFKIASIHSRHEPQSVGCADCHPPAVVEGGHRYSIHDHKFDFSGPELSCGECHEEKEVAGKKAENHDFHLGRVKVQADLTLERACARCHPGKDIPAVLTEWKSGAAGGQ